ncbi:DUF1206 domain-containing protein [Streptomyces albireticuli]|uniref:DUF1206 domain-containing protein n=1 Tax=Streptomyces albireticuli TaxID=1940 RepID=A0A2A2CXG1_9ACTN|nr:DUF1206 domain-containing protein [Streptomyces albireticuli]MCD9194668.1 DUF1206 domain-containing protein [Streptomyces albireticuli]PAU44888.1 hypothetical protein CK936_32405 [Streptomyces albireticuli]
MTRRWPDGGTARAARGTGTAVAARTGLAARGVIYLLVGTLALRVAHLGAGEQADRGGAVQELAEKPFGQVLVWAVGIGMACMALWRLSEAVFGSAGPDGGKARKRLLSVARFVFYAAVAGSVIAFASGERGSGAGSTDEQSRDVTARALDWPAGQWLVAAAGAAVAAAGVWITVRAVTRAYRDHLDLARMSPAVRTAMDVLGVGGGVCRGLVFTVAGAFAVRAAVVYDPEQAKGLDDTLRTFAGTPAGPWLLTVVAVGLALFGLFSLAMARWRRL